MVRIIGGMAKGRKINVPKGLDVRPTLDRVKESIFNILSNRLEGARVLDLYAGSGNLGLESLSRGAREVVFVEKDKAHTAFIQKNLDLLEFKNAMICPIPVFTYVRRFKARAFDIVYIDPPYTCYDHIEFAGDLFKCLLDVSALAPGGIIVIEHLSRIQINMSINTLKLYKYKTYGQTAISMIKFAPYD